ncbi:hypothetical protein E8E13_007968 [Curvularia kusanoi]|uniref:Bacteriophage T5 Orf172 DNA-binding domain-containing protein n=1 Tax=Curvularia kusanoi TaxID=90978 RepID=A0A9P4TM58_CURKU|nr:hypothetical protein E8E13_007968 [Curvularia kusanoi]
MTSGTAPTLVLTDAMIRVQYNLAPSVDFCSTKPSNSANTVLIKEKSYVASFPIPQKSLEIGCAIANDSPATGPYIGLQATLEHIVPSDLHNKLKDYPKLCIASKVKDPSTRCTNKSRNESLKDKDTVLKAVSRCIQKGHVVTLLEKLEELVKIVSEPRIDKLRDFIINLSSASEEDASTFQAWTMALAKLSLPAPTLYNAPKPSLHGVSLKTNMIIASNNKEMPSRPNKTIASPSKPAPPLPGFVPYKSTLISNTDIIRNLKKLIAKQLTVTDLKMGFIYMFWNQGSFGMIKIGRTKDLKRRLKEWQKCKSTHFYHKPSQKGELLEVPHVQRIERLMQTELVNYRRKQPCDTCDKVHEEWFQISEAKAVEVFQKWRDWILKEPYMKNGKGEWVVKPGTLETIPELCVLESEAIQGVKNRSRSTKDRVKRPQSQRLSAMKASDTLKSFQTSHSVSRERQEVFKQ